MHAFACMYACHLNRQRCVARHFCRNFIGRETNCDDDDEDDDDHDHYLYTDVCRQKRSCFIEDS